MKARRFSEAQIIGVLKDAEASAKTKDFCRRHGISEAIFCNWKAYVQPELICETEKLRKMIPRIFDIKLG